MTDTYLTEENRKLHDRNTYRGPYPNGPLPQLRTRPTRHPLAGRTPGVRSFSRKLFRPSS